MTRTRRLGKVQLEARPLEPHERSFLEGLGKQLEHIGCVVSVKPTSPGTETLLCVRAMPALLSNCLTKLGWVQTGGSQDCKLFSHPEVIHTIIVYVRATAYIGLATSCVKPHIPIQARARLKGKL